MLNCIWSWYNMLVFWISQGILAFSLYCRNSRETLSLNLSWQDCRFNGYSVLIVQETHCIVVTVNGFMMGPSMKEGLALQST